MSLTPSEALKLTSKLESAEKTCAHYRNALVEISERGYLAKETAVMALVVATEQERNCGTGYVSKEQVKPMVEALKDVAGHFDNDDDGSHVCWIGETTRIQVEQALTIAKEMGL